MDIDDLELALENYLEIFQRRASDAFMAAEDAMVRSTLIPWTLEHPKRVICLQEGHGVIWMEIYREGTPSSLIRIDCLDGWVARERAVGVTSRRGNPPWAWLQPLMMLREALQRLDEHAGGAWSIDRHIWHAGEPRTKGWLVSWKETQQALRAGVRCG